MVRTIVRGGGCLCACGLTAVLLASAPGATAPQSGGTGPPPDRAQTARLQPQFRAGVDLVTVDVSVLDANRMPVRGLDVSAFTVFEDGEPQPVVAFAEVDVPGADDMPTGWMRDVAPDVTTNTAAGSRLVIMIFDDAQVRMNPRPNIAARAIGHYVVDRLGSDDLAAIIFTKDNRNAVDFTSDRARLHALLEKFHGGGGGAMGFLWNRYSTGVLRSVTDYLTEVRDRRKVIVYVSPGVAGVASGGGADPELRYRLQDTIKQAQLANIAVYPINPAGLVGLDFDSVGAALRGIDDQAAPGPLQAVPSTGRPTGQEAMNQAWDAMNDMDDHLRVLAANTGGFVVGNTNTFSAGVAQIFNENASYYLLGFRPPRPPDGKRRRLEVHVDRPDVIVRARNGYSEPKPAKRGKEPSPIASAIAGLLPDSDLPLRMVLAPFAIPGRKQAAVAVVIGLTRPAVDEPMTDDVHLLVGAFTPEGKSRASKALDARVALRPSAGVDAKYEVLARLDLDPGRYQLRVSAQSASLERTGSVYSELVVPDFRKDAVSLSGVVFGARPPLASAGTEALDPIVPIAPTTQRDFAGHAGTAFVRVYQGGKGALAPVPLTTRIVDETGTRVFERTQVLEPGAFGTTRAADHRLDLPVSSLPAGPYLLTFEVALEEQTARRDVRFVVR